MNEETIKNNRRIVGEHLVAVDLGSDSFRVVVAQIHDGGLRIVGLCERRSEGFVGGLVTDVEKASACLRIAISQAEIMSKHKITDIHLAVGGEHVESFPSKGMVKIQGDEVVEEDVTKVLEMAQTGVNLPPEKVIIDVIETNYEIDGQSGITRPERMTGNRLQGDVLVIAAQANALKNIQRMFTRLGIDVIGWHISSQAAAASCLNQSEQDMGVCLVDFGSHSTDLVLIGKRGAERLHSISEAGNLIDSDLSRVFHVTIDSARDAKCKYGINQNLGSEIEMEDMSGSRQQQFEIASFCEVIEARVDEIFTQVRKHISSELDNKTIAAGLVLVGGSAEMPGLADYLSSSLALPVRIGDVQYRGDLHEVVSLPRYAVVVGVLLRSYQKKSISELVSHGRYGMFRRIYSWFMRLVNSI